MSVSTIVVLLMAGALLLSTVEARLGLADVQRSSNGDPPIEYVDIDKVPIPEEINWEWETIEMFYGAMQYSPEDEGAEDGHRDLKKDDDKDDKNDKKGDDKKAEKNAAKAASSTKQQKTAQASSPAQSPQVSYSSTSKQVQGSSSSARGTNPGCTYYHGVGALGCDRGGARNQVIRVKNKTFGSCYTVDRCLFAAMPKQMAYWCPLQARPCCGGLCYKKSSCSGVRDEENVLHSMESFAQLSSHGYWYANLGHPQCTGF